MRQNISWITGNTIINRSRFILNETAPAFWDDTELLQWTNDAIKDLCNRTLCYQAIETITLTADTVEYAPTNDYIRIVSVRYIDADSKEWGLKPSTPGMMGSVPLGVLGGSIPRYWYEFAGKVGVFPALTSVSTEQIKIYEAKQPATIEASDAIPTPTIFDTAIVNYVVGIALIKDRKNDFAKGFLASYEATADRFRADFIEQPQAES